MMIAMFMNTHYLALKFTRLFSFSLRDLHDLPCNYIHSLVLLFKCSHLPLIKNKIKYPFKFIHISDIALDFPIQGLNWCLLHFLYWQLGSFPLESPGKIVFIFVCAKPLHNQMFNTEIRLIVFFAAKDGEALYSNQKQDQEPTLA